MADEIDDDDLFDQIAATGAAINMAHDDSLPANLHDPVQDAAETGASQLAADHRDNRR